ncbi:MAG: DoxX family protein [Gemmatimonadetes bacterium]|nr:DoxX family protein [Gemmatimonadota bacterium]
MVYPLPEIFTDVALLFLRLLIAAIFGSSGWSHFRQPEERAEGLGMSPGATRFLGAVEVLGAALLVVGLWDQIAAAALIVVMLGAIHRKMFVWNTGFWGDDSNGWYYDLLYLVCNLVIVATAGGAIGIDGA